MFSFCIRFFQIFHRCHQNDIFLCGDLFHEMIIMFIICNHWNVLLRCMSFFLSSFLLHLYSHYLCLWGSCVSAKTTANESLLCPFCSDLLLRFYADQRWGEQEIYVTWIKSNSTEYILLAMGIVIFGNPDFFSIFVFIWVIRVRRAPASFEYFWI